MFEMIGMEIAVIFPLTAFLLAWHPSVKERQQSPFAFPSSASWLPSDLCPSSCPHPVFYGCGHHQGVQATDRMPMDLLATPHDQLMLELAILEGAALPSLANSSCPPSRARRILTDRASAPYSALQHP